MNMEQGTVCKQCPLGKFAAEAAASSMASCGICEWNRNLFSDTEGLSACKTCVAGRYAYTILPGDSGGTQCGDSCLALGEGFNLGALVIQSDPRMLNINTGRDTVPQQLARLKTILQEVNMDGDKYISRTEMIRGLSLVAVSLSQEALATTPLWCPLANGGCYTAVDEMARMPLDTIVKEASMSINLFGTFTPAVGLVVSANFREPTEIIISSPIGAAGGRE
jgi:hypothetical protein